MSVSSALAWIVTTLALLVECGVLAPAARAADGLAFVGALRDGVDGSNGLAGPLGIAVSPDGAHVYVAAFRDQAIGVFVREPETGTLTFLEVQQQGVGAVQDLNGPLALGLSPDGAHVYVASQPDNAIVVFRRDPSSGRLTFVQSRRDGVDGDGLGGVAGVTVSPDGAHVYATGRFENAVAAFARDAATGELTFVEAKRNEVGGVSGLGRPAGLMLSPDGVHLYVTSNVDNAVVVFARDAGTGALTFVEAQQEGVAGVSGLTFATSVVVSPDGAHVYVAANLDNAIVMFARNAGTGALSFLGVRQDGVGGVSGLVEVAALAIDSAGRNVFAASQAAGAVAVFSRDAGTGQLGFVQFRRDGTGGVDGLQGAASLAVSPDAANVYAAGYIEDALVTFRVVPLTGGCPPVPNVGCRRSVKPRKTSLLLRDRTSAAKDLLSWKWIKGSETKTADLGDPTTGTGYFVCLYAPAGGAPSLVLEAEAPAGDGWRSTRAKGFSYARKDGAPDGLRRVALKPGAAGKARVVVQGSGTALRLPTLPLVPPVKLQLDAANGQCWEADYPSPARNTVRLFKARGQ